MDVSHYDLQWLLGRFYCRRHLPPPLTRGWCELSIITTFCLTAIYYADDGAVDFGKKDEQFLPPATRKSGKSQRRWSRRVARRYSIMGKWLTARLPVRIDRERAGDRFTFFQFAGSGTLSPPISEWILGLISTLVWGLFVFWTHRQVIIINVLNCGC